MTILISDLKTKIVTKNKGHFLMLKNQEGFIINIYNNRVPKYMKQKTDRIEGRNNSRVTVGDFISSVQ